MKRLATTTSGFDAAFASLLSEARATTEDVEKPVAAIIAGRWAEAIAHVARAPNPTT